MVRVKRGRVARRYRKKVFSLTKGAIGSNLYLFRIAKQHAIKAIKYAYAGRRARKRQYRSSWIVRLNARVRIHGWNYSFFLYYLRKKNCLLNRKILSQIASYDKQSFQTLLNLSSHVYHFSTSRVPCTAYFS